MDNGTYIWCGTRSETPRKHAHPEPAIDIARFDVTLGNGQEDRIVNAGWRSRDIDAMVSINVATLRLMLAAADGYKPGATLTKPNG